MHLEHQTLFVTGFLGFSTAHPLIERIQTLQRLHTQSAIETVTFVIDSNGGEGRYGLIAYDEIRSMESAGISTKCLIRNAKSAAALVALACNDRIIERAGVVQFHLGDAVVRACDTLVPSCDTLESSPEIKILQDMTDIAHRMISCIRHKLGETDSEPIITALTAKNVHEMRSVDCVRSGFARLADY